ncbi:MAG: PHP domain-containing protein [Anaerolineae bacterium]|nr:PHP domain-containing protein [Anaerolineae bacterium]
MQTWLKVDFHCHTFYSGDSLNTPQKLIAAARRAGLDRLVITDHNTIRGALHARQLDPELVIVGEEIETTRGELLASFVSEEIPAGLEPMEAINRLRQQGAFISVSHPFDTMRMAWSAQDLEAILPFLDAIEIFNASCLNDTANLKAQQYARQKGLSGTAGSDAHSLAAIGRTWLNVPWFSNAEELRAAIPQAHYQGKLTPWWGHFGSTMAFFHRRLGIEPFDDNKMRLS